jgi:hypothetical protein
MVGDHQVSVDEPRLVRRIDERRYDHDLIDVGGENVEPGFAAGHEADERALAGEHSMDDSLDLSHGIELDPVSNGDLVPEGPRRVFEQTASKVALQDPRFTGSIGAHRDFLSLDLEDRPGERRRDRFHGEERSML